MNEESQIATLVDGLVKRRRSVDQLDHLGSVQRTAAIDLLLTTAAGRRWLRESPILDRDLAQRLVSYAGDYDQQRVDRSLDRVIELVPLDELASHAPAIAAGSGAPTLWMRLAEDSELLASSVHLILEQGADLAIEATATHLLLDPSNPYGINRATRLAIARSILSTDIERGRGIAAGYLASNAPDELMGLFDQLARDSSTQVRASAWLAAYKSDQARAINLATSLLGDESVAVDVRRSALNATGEAVATDQIIGLLSYFVVHPTEALALDAANLLHRHHRHPEIAIAAANSPHDEVREVANRLMDPYRGSPAAGGSRPGDPLRSDPLLELMRQIEEEETEK